MGSFFRSCLGFSTVALSLLVAGCCSSGKYVNTANLPDTYQCSYMKDVCKEAREYEAKYEQMNKEEKTEFKTVLDTYRSQCNDALEACKKSGPASSK